ncbi:MAG: DUF1302 family protein [Pseudomonadota bacterium]
MRISLPPRRLTLLAAAMLAWYGAAGGAQAGQIETGVDDLQLRVGTTVRYNAGFRMERRDHAIAYSPSSDEGDNSYDRHDMVNNRLDVLTELDLSYKNVGARLSGALWADAAFNNKVKTAPGLEGRGSYINNEFSDYTKRFHKGPSGEFLDAYLFANLDFGGMPFNVKVGRQTNLWGEALVLSTHSVSYAQAPSDGLKAVASPGVDNKEIALPIGQVHASLQVTDNLSLAAQYFYEWKPTRLAQGGTYLAATDFLLLGPDQFSAAPGITLVNGKIVEAKGREFGLSARYKTEALGATVGAYYRVFNERSPSLSLDIPNRIYYIIYPEDTKLFGLSLAKNIGGVSIGAELVRRNDTVLASTLANGSRAVARGNTWHGLVNAVTAFGQNPVFDGATLTTELAYAKLDKITQNAANFNGCVRPGLATRDEETGCASASNWQGTIRFSPSWTAVRIGWDLGATASLTYGLKGNGAVLGGGNYKGGSWTVGTTLTYNQQHDFTLAYSDYLATKRNDPVTGLIQFSNGSQLQDRGWLSLTYKGSF